jgi:hypothetical protein
MLAVARLRGTESRPDVVRRVLCRRFDRGRAAFCGGGVARPRVDHGGHGVDEAVAGAGDGEGGEEDGEVVVVELELGAAVGVGGVDPLAAAEEPVAGVAALLVQIRKKTQHSRNICLLKFEDGRPGDVFPSYPHRS